MVFSRQSDWEQFFCQTLCSGLLSFSYKPTPYSISAAHHCCILRSRDTLPHSQHKPIKVHLQGQHGMVGRCPSSLWANFDQLRHGLWSSWKSRVRSIYRQFLALCGANGASTGKSVGEAG